MTTFHARKLDDDDENSAGAMGFLDHLEELRKRLIRACIAIAVGMGVSWFFIDRIADFVLAQILRTLPPGSELIYTNPSDGFAFWFNLSLIAGIALAAPFVIYQVWGFIAPGLYSHEKKFVVPFVLFTAIGTLLGALFANYLLFPGMMKFFGTFSTGKIRMLPSINETFDHYLLMMLGMIAVFQLPTLVYFLAKLRLVTAGFLWRNFKYAILIIFIAAALLTASPDWWNQTAFALPMVGLYLISIGIAWVVGPRDQESTDRLSRSIKLGLLVAASHLQWGDAHRKRSSGPRLVHPQR